jgi:hypothetical protein
MYDISVASMKIGVALPIANASFRFWDNPGTWTQPTGWVNKSSNWAISRHWTGYDDDRASMEVTDTNGIADAAFPNAIESGDTLIRRRWWPANALGPGSSVAVYYSFAWGYSTGTPGVTNPLLLNNLEISDQDGTPTSKGNVGPVVTTSDVLAFPTRETGTVVLTSVASTQRFFLFNALKANDWTGTVTAQIDSIGAMVNPYDWDNLGYLELTNVFPANGPNFAPENFVQSAKTPLGTVLRHDVSGGFERYRLGFELRNEPQSVYQNLRRFYDLNRGTPGIEGVPLLIEPNIPGMPNVLMVNMVGNSFPLRRTTAAAERYAGILVFETIW